MELESNYEITRVANYILTHNFSRVAFQVKKKKNSSSSIFTNPYHMQKSYSLLKTHFKP